MTPWDWRQAYELKRMDVWGDDAGQPQVRWQAIVRDRATGEEHTVDGHVEVRWSHGRFGKPPEAKAYLDTPHHRVPGYVTLTLARDACGVVRRSRRSAFRRSRVWRMPSRSSSSWSVDRRRGAAW